MLNQVLRGHAYCTFCDQTSTVSEQFSVYIVNQLEFSRLSQVVIKKTLIIPKMYKMGHWWFPLSIRHALQQTITIRALFSSLPFEDFGQNTQRIEYTRLTFPRTMNSPLNHYGFTRRTPRAHSFAFVGFYSTLIQP